MANSIESQVRQELFSLEQIVTAVECLGNISPGLRPEDAADLSYVHGYLGTELQRQFQAFHETVSQRLLPLVADIKSVKLA
jgi:hypothetical protein